ncbi:hypothetical protein UFOVP783_69 [uncultured Caudovirales phage]|uniref:Uncharacterized protein n=1 Tax=uncultured Caudovirales phage TaxID=2100421 RepID=A0A6J5NUV3_9CAUD|nr:hypothetical protein UFOVP783_69 [uncultured Caudovirales phage]
MSYTATPLARRPKQPRKPAPEADAGTQEDKELDAIMGDSASSTSTIPDADAAALLVGSGYTDGIDGSGWVIAGFHLRLLCLADLMILLRQQNPLVMGTDVELADKLQAACEVLHLCSQPTSRDAVKAANSPSFTELVLAVAESIPYGPESFGVLTEVMEYLQAGGATRVSARNPTVPGLPPSAEGNDCPPPGQSA